MVIKNSKSRTEYYQEYYLRHKDRYKYLYYSKKLADEERLEFFKEFGGERKYYENYYKNWNKLQLKK
jgi:hypothetical protein